MPTIHSLPPELLHNILELGAELPVDACACASYNDLLTASLVSRAWHAEAQPLLWRRVVLSDATSAEFFAASVSESKESFATVELVVCGLDHAPSGWRSGLAEEVLEACMGVRYLHLGYVQLPLRALYAPQLSGLTSLFLEATFDLEDTPAPTGGLPFQLSALRLDCHYEPLPPDLIIPLLQHSITSLTIEGWHFRLDTILPCLSAPETLAPRLSHLELPYREDEEVFALGPFLANCHNLASFFTYINTVCESLPWLCNSRITTLKIRECDDWWLDYLLDLLRSGAVKVAQLREMQLMMSREQFEEWGGSEAMEDECERRGIALELLGEEGG